MDDYYALLGITKTASEDDIKRAYRKLAQQYHPDRPTGNEKKFKEINEAYQVLSNAEKRAQYDRFGKTFNGAGPGGSGGFGQGGFGFDFNGANFGGDFGDFGDIFESFFGGMGGSAGWRRRKTYTRGNDLQINQEITLEEAYRGIKKELSFKAYTVCDACAGLGHFAKEGVKTCGTCNGRGEIKEVRNTFFGNFQQVRACAKCNGAGEIPNKPCTNCKGSGRLVKPRTISIDILAGVADGQLIKITGAGETGERSAPAGDLYVSVRVAPDKVFRRDGPSLLIKREVTMTDILRGKPIEITLISGERLSVEIPNNFSLSERIRVAGKGMPQFGGRGYGDLYIELDVRTPKKVSSKAKKLLEDLDNEIA